MRCFSIAMSIMAVEAVKFHLSFISYLFCFFPYPYSRTKGVQLVSQREMLKIKSCLSRHLQVGSKVSRRNTKSHRDTWKNILAVKDNVTFEETVNDVELFKKQTVTISPNQCSRK
jgi:hypothetical protein